MALYAQFHGVTHMRVEQLCDWSQHGVVGEDESAGATDGGTRDVVIALSTHKGGVTVPFNGVEKHIVSKPGVPFLSLVNLVPPHLLALHTLLPLFPLSIMDRRELIVGINTRL